MRHAISFRPPPSPRYTLSTPSVLPAVRAQTMRRVNGHCPPRSNMLLGCSVDTHGVHARRPQTRQEPGGSVRRAVRGRDLPVPCRRLSSHICIIHTCMHTSAAARLQSPVAPPCFWGSNQPQKPPSPALHHPQNGVQPGEEAEGGRRRGKKEKEGGETHDPPPPAKLQQASPSQRHAQVCPALPAASNMRSAHHLSVLRPSPSTTSSVGPPKHGDVPNAVARRRRRWKRGGGPRGSSAGESEKKPEAGGAIAAKPRAPPPPTLLAL